MHSAGQRQTKQPDRYNPSSYYQSPILPSTDFDLTMSNPNEEDLSLTDTVTPSLTSLQQQIDDMNKVFHQQLDSFACRFTEYDEKFHDLCTRVDEIDSDITSKLTQIQTNFHADFVAIQGNISESIVSNENSHSTTLNESINHMNSVQRSLNTKIQSLSDRICVTEGQASRLAAIENRLQNISLNHPPSIQPSVYQRPPQINSSVSSRSTQPQINSNVLSSTILPNISKLNSLTSQSISVIPNGQNNSNLSNNSSISNNLSHTSAISLDPHRVPKYNGQLSPTHPADFLDKVDQYFLMHNASDQVKINFISDNFTGKALLWYNTLLPPPVNYNDFVSLFKDYFWSQSLQRSIRNELYRPYYHRDEATMSEHAMDWISRARHLQPPIDQMEMVDQITSHFSYNVSLALKGLRILTTNELIKQLTYLQRAHVPQNHNNSNSTSNNNYRSNSQQQNSRSHSSQNQHRYNNNYNRPQYHNNDNNDNAQPSSPPDHAVSPPGN